MAPRNTKKKCVRCLNCLRALLGNTKTDDIQATSSVHSFFSDIDKSVQYIKRRVRKGSPVTHDDDPLLIHICHLYYFLCLKTGRASLMKDFVQALAPLRWSAVWLCTMIDEDTAFMNQNTSEHGNFLWNTWCWVKCSIFKAVVGHDDGNALFGRAVTAYCAKVLCHGHASPPGCASVFRMLMQRETTAGRISCTQRMSPTQLVRWQGSRKLSKKAQICRGVTQP